jgi:glycosyltransferase involved in cell wall biosynthesis
MHLFFNGLAASAGAGLTYFRNVVPELSSRTGTQITVALTPGLRREFKEAPKVSFLELGTSSATRRFWQEQTLLPSLIQRCGADVLVSTGNFALRNSPVPQVLLSGNSLYTSAEFYRDLRARGDYRIFLDTRIKAIFARRSIHWANCTVAPSETYAKELRRWTGGNVVSIYHGFDADLFFRDSSSLPVDIQQKLLSADNALRLLFVSHYNYYRNFETLLRAIPILRGRMAPRKVKLFLTCKLSSGENPGSYRAEAAARLVRQLGISDHVVELGAVPYHLLHHIYRTCDIYVTPAYAETFAHPLVEAMASGLPIVASDLDVHREVCGEAAIYFQCFSPEELASQVLRIAFSQDLAQTLADHGLSRSQAFSWPNHVDRILSLACELIGFSRSRC